MWLSRRVPTEGRQFRDPRAATASPIQYFWLRRNFNWNSKQAVAEALYSNIYVYACARARAVDLASLPIRVGADPARPKDFDPKHELAKLLGPAPGKPTINISSRQLIAWSSVQFDVTGRFAWEIAPPVTAGKRGRRDGVPFELWPLPSGNLLPKQSMGGADWFSGFEYEIQGYSKRHLTNEQVMYHWRPGQNDWREPESLLKAAGLNVSIAVMQDRYDHAFLVNDARPAAVMVHEEFKRKKERDAFRRGFLDTHQGADNAGKIQFVEANREGAQPKDSLFIQTLGLSQRDAEFIERYENQIRAICVAFATPLSRLADSSRRTYANAERETKNYWRNGIYEQGVEIAEGINTDLMPMIDPNNVMWFDTTGVPELEPPRRYSVGDIPALKAARVITTNEARTGLELPPIDEPWADELDPMVNEPQALPPGDGPMPALPPGDRAASMLVVRAISSDCARLADRLTERMLDSMRTRLGSKRGRQAIGRGSTAWDLLDEAYWFDVAVVEFAGWARSVAISACIDMGVSHNESRVDAWSERWGHALADRWMTSWRAALQVPADLVDDFTASDIQIDPLIAHTVWVSARSAMADQQVELASVSDLIMQLHRGELSTQEALLALG